MNITIKYFAQFREQAKLAQEILTIEDGHTIQQLFNQINAKHQFSIDHSVVRFACNNEYVAPDHQLKDGDTIAFISPIAGG